MSPQEYLAAAEAALAAEQTLEGSRLLWLAVVATFDHLAEVHKLDSGNRHQLARALDAKEGRNAYYLGSLGVATGLKYHAQMNSMEPYEVESCKEIVAEFVKDVL